MWKTELRTLALIALAILPFGCGGGGGGAPGGDEPGDPSGATLRVLGPDRAEPFALGVRVPITFAATDPGGVGVVVVVVDADQDPATTTDQTLVATVQGADGAEQEVHWEAPGAGTWVVFARMTTSAGAEISATGPQPFTVTDLSGAKHGGSATSSARGRCVASRDGGPTLIAGECRGSDFAFNVLIGGEDPQNPASRYRPMQPDGLDDIYYAETEQSLDFRWWGQVGGSGNAAVRGLTHKGGDGAFYMSGKFNGEIIFNRHLDAAEWRPLTGSNPAAASGPSDGFLVRISGEGEVLWWRRLATPGNSSCFEVVLLADGGCVVAGWFDGTAAWSHGGSVLDSQGSIDGFVTWYDADGGHVRTHVLENVGQAGVTGLAVLPEGHVVVGGEYEGELTVPGAGQSAEILPPIAGAGRDVFYVVYDASGRRHHAGRIGGQHDDHGGPITDLADGRWMMAGTFLTSTQIGLGSPNEKTLNGHGDEDVFLVVHDRNGSFHAGAHIGGPGADFVHDVALHTDGRVLLAGQFEGECQYTGPVAPAVIPGTPTAYFSSAGGEDIFAFGLFSDLQLDFATTAGASVGDAGLGIASRNDGSFTLTGHFAETIRFVVDESTAHAITASSPQDAFIARFNADGSNTGYREIWSIEGTTANQELGGSVALIGDVNGDGRSEFAAGEGEAHGSGYGVVHIYDGATGVEIKTLTYGRMGSGGSLARGGDMNGDGVPDLIAADPLDDTGGTNAGRLLVYSGVDWSLHFGANGDQAGDKLGTTIGGDGDVTNDGLNEVVVGAVGDASVPTSRAYIRLYDGRNGNQIFSAGPPATSGGGWAHVGRLAYGNRDAWADISVCAPRADYTLPHPPGTSWTQCGCSYAYNGVDVATNGNTATLLGPFAGSEGDYHFWGDANAFVGDMDGDGTEDVGIGATGASSGAGSVTVMPGDPGGTVFSFDGPTGSQTGAALAYAGDIDGDGKADCVVGSPLDSSGGATWGGAVRVFGAGDFSLVFVWYGTENGMHAGSSVDGGRDVDGDGNDDIIVGAPALSRPSGAGSRVGVVKVFGKR